MAEKYSIWTPVIVGRLKNPCRIQVENSYSINKVYKAIEDLKIKVKDHIITAQGRLVELEIKVDILCLLEDFLGSMHLIVQEEIIREKIKLEDFDVYIEHNRETKYIIDTLKLRPFGELNGEVIKVACFIDLTIIATNEQIISLALSDELRSENDSLQEILQKLRVEVTEIEAEKTELRRKIFFYERDISSLKKGIVKAENKNARLNKELKKFQDLVGQLRDTVNAKEEKLNRYENPYYNYGYASGIEPYHKEDISNLGSRIKRMFAQN
ncbi:MAG TPA: hypothetical protein VFD02_05820 [Syntrophomonadaceae bacterium]|nr:hypothetical protein [Syntrophomonadaceae bacterium]